MKTILIEAVSNGWIVRPFQCCETWASTDRPVMAVYTNIRDLQAAIPTLLDVTYGPEEPRLEPNDYKKL